MPSDRSWRRKLSVAPAAPNTELDVGPSTTHPATAPDAPALFALDYLLTPPSSPGPSTIPNAEDRMLMTPPLSRSVSGPLPRTPDTPPASMIYDADDDDDADDDTVSDIDDWSPHLSADDLLDMLPNREIPQTLHVYDVIHKLIMNIPVDPADAVPPMFRTLFEIQNPTLKMIPESSLRLSARLGRGSTSHVFDAIMRLDSGSVPAAVKVYGLDVARPRPLTLYRNMMVRELSVLRAALKAKCRHVIKLLGYSTVLGYPAIIVEKADAVLQEFLTMDLVQRYPRYEMSLADRLDCVADAVLGAMELEHLNITHGDLNPTNILVFEGLQGRPVAKLADLVTAINIFPDNQGRLATTTVMYAAPEHLLARYSPGGNPWGHPASVWSLAVVAAEAIARCRWLMLIAATNPRVILDDELRERYHPLILMPPDRVPENDLYDLYYHYVIKRQFRPVLPEYLNIGPNLKIVLERCFSHEPEQRPTLKELYVALRAEAEIARALSDPPTKDPASPAGKVAVRRKVSSHRSATIRRDVTAWPEPKS
ncbi:Protein kinase domain-containing protein [Plasmodiophora brassicae]